MKKKKILARIGAMIACALIVASLAIPAFADEPTAEAEGETRVTVPLGTAQQLFGTMIGTASTDAYENLFSRYLSYGDNRFFTMDYLVSGSSMSFGSAIPFDINVGADTTSIFAQIPVDMVSYVFYADSMSPAYINTFDGGSINLTIYANNVDGYRVVISYVANGDAVAKFAYVYRGLTQDYLSLESVAVEGNTITPTYSRAEIAFTIARASSDWSPMLTTVCSLLFEDSTPQQLDNVLFSPKQFYYGLNEAYNLGHEFGWRYGYDNGYDMGYDNGYDVGYQEGVDTDSYQAGYDKAVSEIDSGDFGKNFIGSVISAPFDALENFTLVSWDLSNGGTVSITLATIVSAGIGICLLIWFLKMFAGG